MRGGSDRRRALSGLHRGLCALGAAGAFAGMLLESNAIFLVGIGVGIPGYLGVRRELRRGLEEGNGEDVPSRK